MRPRVTQVREAAMLRELREAGLSYPEIALKIVTHKETVRLWGHGKAMLPVFIERLNKLYRDTTGRENPTPRSLAKEAERQKAERIAKRRAHVRKAAAR